jgi:ABC-type phosphate/phosphonate transport system substrate-binding protein
MVSFRVAATLALALLSVGPAPAPAADAAPGGPTRTFAAIPFYGPEKMWLLYTPFVEYLRQQTGEAWELKLFASHDEMIAGVCGGTVDVVLLGPVPLGAVNRTCGAAPFLLPLAKDGEPAYHSMLLTADSAVRSVADLRGRKVGFFKGSTAAHVLPLRMLADAGLSEGSYTPVFLESQDKLVTALLDGSIAAAGVKEALYRRFEKGPLRLLQTSEPLPNFSFSALPSRPPALRESFAAALLKLRPREAAADAEVVKGWDDEVKNGFVPPAADFLPAVLRLYDLSLSLRHESE